MFCVRELETSWNACHLSPEAAVGCCLAGTCCPVPVQVTQSWADWSCWWLRLRNHLVLRCSVALSSAAGSSSAEAQP